MSEEDYDKRKGTLRDWIKQQKAKDENWQVGILLPLFLFLFLLLLLLLLAPKL